MIKITTHAKDRNLLKYLIHLVKDAVDRAFHRLACRSASPIIEGIRI